MMYLRNYLGILGFFLACSSMAYAASTDFTVHTLIGDDTTPPTVPSGLTTTPVAVSQINLSWSASTDDLILSGYQVFRDAVQIATTTATNYSDVGLTPSTTYAYYITAFDSFGNISGSSTVVSTTTLSSTTPTATTTIDTSGITTGSIVPFQIIRLEVLPERDSVIIRYETRGFVRGIVKWGKGISYELGSLRERSFARQHETLIVGLTPGTTYQFSIEGENHLGMFGALTEGTFTTLGAEDVFPPGNVTGLTVARDRDDVLLTWNNPGDTDFSHVRVLRSDLFYPSDLADGWVVYDGDEEEARDIGVVVPGKKLYYTVFSYDALGNVSSGAIVSFMVQVGTSSVVVPPPIIETENGMRLSFSDMQFVQDATLLPVENGQVTIDGTKRLTIAIPYDVLPEHLKTIVVSLASPEDPQKTFDFLLRVNKERTAFMAYVAPLSIRGVFPVTVSVFNYKTAQIGFTKGTLISEIISRLITHGEQAPSGILGRLSVLFAETNGYFFIFICLLIVLLFLSRRLLHAEW